MTYNITLTANHQSLTAKYLPLAAESVQYLTAKVVYETDDWTGREIKAMFEHGHTVYEVPVTGGEITANQQLNLTAGDWRVWLIGNSARDGDVIPRITTNIAHIIVAPTGGTEGSPFPAIPPTVEEQLRADMGNLADLTTEDKSSLVAAINEAAESGGAADAVTYTPQTLTEEQRAQARTNIGAYTKPASGIPKSDLADDVQTSLAKADTALQSQTIPDWNQNDETAPDYVKNRPFYTGDPVETVLVEESTVSFADQGGMYAAAFPSTFEATVGEIYKVSWDGTVYECTCVSFSDIPVIGNLSIVGAGSDTGEPFLMVVRTGEGIDIGTADTSASHTFSISGLVTEVVKIDPKYIRDMYYTGNPVETVLVEESTVSFAEDQGLYGARVQSTFEATVGETYKVSWDGTAYECTCASFKNRPAIGNLSITGAGSDTGEPFIMVVDNGRGITIVTADTSASHTFSISGFVQEVVKIDEKYLPNTVATKSEVEAAQTAANAAQTTAENAQTTAENAQTTAENAQTTANAALPKTGGTMSGNLTIDTENDSYQTIISPGKMALQYVRSTGDVGDELVISGLGIPRIVAREGDSDGFKLSNMGLSLGYTSEDKDGIHLYHSNGSSSAGEIVIQHTNINNHTEERISIASTGKIKCNNRLKFDCGSEIEVVQTYGKTGGSAIILRSSTPNSTKKFKITVDDSGAISATEVS